MVVWVPKIIVTELASSRPDVSRKQIKILEWTSKITDLNPIGNLCRELKFNIHAKKKKNGLK